MNATAKYPHTLGLILGGLGLMAMSYYLTKGGHYRDKLQRERERKAFDEIDSTQLTPRQVWDRALEFGRKERLDLRSELEQSRAILEHAEELCEIAEGLRKTAAMARDPSVPMPVKETIAKHWFLRFTKFFDLPENPIDGIFDDASMLKRVGEIEKATNKYRDAKEIDKTLIRKAIDALNRKSDSETIVDDRERCSFCGTSANKEKKLAAGPGVYICKPCATLAAHIIKDDP